MLSNLEQVVSGAFASLQGVAGIQVTYRRGGQSVSLTAVPAMSRFTVENEHGFKTSLRVHDFLIAACDLQIDGQRFEPQPGDEIETQRPDGVMIYVVMSPGPGEPDWKYSDTARSRVRIHTKFMESVA